jgi:hypothetical protein
MPQLVIDPETEVLLFAWDNEVKVAQGQLRGPIGPKSCFWMSLQSLNIMHREVQDYGAPSMPPVPSMPAQAAATPVPGPHPLLAYVPVPPETTTEAVEVPSQQIGVVRHAHNRPDGVAFYNNLQTALHNVHGISGTIPNNTRVEVIDHTNSSYAEVRWNGRGVFIRQMHLQMPQDKQAVPASPAQPAPPPLPPPNLPAPTPPAARKLEVRHSKGQASVAWFYTATAALRNPNNYDGTVPNGEQVELINANADGQHVFAAVRWRGQDVTMRTVHLRGLPVQLLNQDGRQHVHLFENVTGAQRNTPIGYLPNGTKATVDNPNLDGNYTLTLVNLPMGPMVVRSVDLQGLPQRNYTTPSGTPHHHLHASQPPMPPQVLPWR